MSTLLPWINLSYDWLKVAEAALFDDLAVVCYCWAWWCLERAETSLLKNFWLAWLFG